MWSCDKRELSTCYFSLTWRRLDGQSTGGKVNFLLDPDLASNREKGVWTPFRRGSVHRDPTNAQRNCQRIEEGAGAKVQHPCEAEVCQRSVWPWKLDLVLVLTGWSQPSWGHRKHMTGLLSL